MKSRSLSQSAYGVLGIAILLQAAGSAAPVDFNRDVRPLLSNNCFTCHGPDQATREADLRLDIKDGLLADLGGYRIITPGQPEQSELYARVSAEDADARMPPADAQHQLTAAQVDVLRRWIAEGAQWNQHWSFVQPQRLEPPAAADRPWCHNGIDRFILDRLEKEGLSPSPEAGKATLIRRATLDLTGLPPTPAEVDAFMADNSPQAYERLVDRLLASPRYGEQMTRYWLDVARYGDTHGLHLDNERSIWPYRDWLIAAFNDNKPFDQFTIEQLAGDLLPSPTVQQRVATGFNRAHVTTSEGGAIDEEFLVRYTVDRTDTVGTVWLGLTVGCAVCHDHKFDPISQKEFYGLYAFFNSTQDKPMDGNALLPPPVIEIPSPEQSRARAQLQSAVAKLEKEIRQELSDYAYTDPAPSAKSRRAAAAEVTWIDDTLPPGALPEGGAAGWRFVTKDDAPVYAGSKAVGRAATGLAQHVFTGVTQPLTVGAGDKLFAHVYLDPKDPPKAIMLQFNDGTWEHRAFWGEDLITWGYPETPSRRAMGALPEAGRWVRLEVEVARVGLRPGSKIGGWAFTQHGGTVYWDTAGIVSRTPQPGQDFESQRAWELAARDARDPALPAPLIEALKVEPADRKPAQARLVREYFLQRHYAGTRQQFARLNGRLDEKKKELEALSAAIPRSLVTEELPAPRETFLLERGEYDKPGEKVFRSVPAALPPLPPDAPRNRLGLARWLVDPSHPLTARVTVNRFWQQVFGTGIVKTAEDFGAQGELPTHPELLDWLAVQFVENGWDVKHLMRLMLTSAAYRQSSRITPELYRRDPENRLLARGPRFRMDAEMVRDQALAVSGLLAGTIGGPSVKPYQPSGLWEAISYTSSNTARFVQDHGDKLYRRSMYIFWKRTSPPPLMTILDAPSRETCTARRSRTNTPLAALALMNDIQFFEAARKLAERMMREGGDRPEEQAAYAFRLATARSPQRAELEVMLRQYREQLAEYQADKAAADKALAVGESPAAADLDRHQLAAWTMVASTILNLDETVTKN